MTKSKLSSKPHRTDRQPHNRPKPGADKPVGRKGRSIGANGRAGPEPVKRGERSAAGPSKKELVLDLLSRTEGATIATIGQATDWQPHSVRGFLSSVVRKRLGLDLQSDRSEGGERVYRLTADQAAKPESTPAARAQNGRTRSAGA